MLYTYNVYMCIYIYIYTYTHIHVIAVILTTILCDANSHTCCITPNYTTHAACTTSGRRRQMWCQEKGPLASQQKPASSNARSDYITKGLTGNVYNCRLRLVGDVMARRRAWRKAWATTRRAKQPRRAVPAPPNLRRALEPLHDRVAALRVQDHEGSRRPVAGPMRSGRVAGDWDHAGHPHPHLRTFIESKFKLSDSIINPTYWSASYVYTCPELPHNHGSIRQWLKLVAPSTSTRTQSAAITATISPNLNTQTFQGAFILGCVRHKSRVITEVTFQQSALAVCPFGGPFEDIRNPALAGYARGQVFEGTRAKGQGSPLFLPEKGAAVFNAKPSDAYSSHFKPFQGLSFPLAARKTRLSFPRR